MTAGVLAAHTCLRSCGRRLIDQRPLSAPEVPSCGSFSPYSSPSSRAEACRLPPASRPPSPAGVAGHSYDYLREIRPLFVAARTTQRTIYRPAEICQFDVWQPRAEVLAGSRRVPRRRDRGRLELERPR